MVRIAHLLDKMPGQCSGGESQRVALARTLVTNPSTFLLDEPLSSLDAKLRRELRAECDRLHQELKRTFIFVTHDQEEAMTLADRIVVMRDGEIEQFGSPMEIYSEPGELFRRRLLRLAVDEPDRRRGRGRARCGCASARARFDVALPDRFEDAAAARRPSASGPSTWACGSAAEGGDRAAAAAGRAARQGHAALFRRRDRARLHCGQRGPGDRRGQAGARISLSFDPRPAVSVRRGWTADGADECRPRASGDPYAVSSTPWAPSGAALCAFANGVWVPAFAADDGHPTAIAFPLFAELHDRLEHLVPCSTSSSGTGIGRLLLTAAAKR